MTDAQAWPEPADLLLHYDCMLEALEQLDRAARAGRLGPSSRFAGMTLPEFDARLRELRGELDHEVSMALLASCEALLRFDFKERVKRRRKEPRSVRDQFKAIDARDRERVRLEDILDVWKGHIGSPARFDAFQEYLGVRHWLAHGRYWSLKTRRRIAPQDLLAVIRALFAVLPADFPTL